MSLNGIMNSAVTGMLSHQKALQITSTNVANAQTEGYARKVVEYGAIVLDGVGQGVEISDIRRVTDEFISRELRATNSSTQQYAAMTEIHSQLQALLGDPADNASLTGKLDNVFTALAALPADATSSVARTSALLEIQNFGIETDRLLSKLQLLRKEADSHIAEEINVVNDAILRIHALNTEIVKAEIGGTPTGDLEDQRDSAIADISSVMDVKTYAMNHGAVAVVSESGLQLLDFSPRQLVYNPVATVTTDTDFGQITVNVYDEKTDTVAASGLALDPELQSGSLRGWLDMRNLELPEIAAQIGNLAAGVAEQLNAVHNDNIAVPPPATLTGRNSGISSTESHGFTGQATFYSFDANNDIAAQYTVDFDNVGTVTLDDVMTEVNGALGAGSLSMASGVMTMTAVGASGVAIVQDATLPADRGGRGFSHFFGMNDLVEAVIETSFDTGLAAGDIHNFTGQTEMVFRGPDGQEPVSMTVDFDAIGANMSDVITEMNTNLGSYATASLDSYGAIVITPATGYDDYKIAVTNDTSDRAATGTGFPEMFGMGLRYPTDSGAQFQVRTDIMASPMLMALADIDATGSPALNLADSRGALQLQDLATSATSFASVGSLPGSSVSATEYAAQVLAKAGLDAARADSLKADRGALNDVLKNKQQEVAGVNMDEELANLIIFQNAYNAAARVITTARDMYDILLNIT